MEKVIANLQPTGYDSPIENTVGDYKVSGSIRVNRDKSMESMEGNVTNGEDEFVGRFTINGGSAIVRPDGSTRKRISLNDVPVDIYDAVSEAVNATLTKVQSELANPEE